MGVTVFNDKYVRVTRAWDKEETQIYVPIKKSLKAAIKEAEKIDRELEEKQKAFLLKQEQSGERYFHEDGMIVGLRVVTRHREGRKPSNEITLRIKVPGREKPYFSNVSIDKHGFDQAFKLAVDKISEWNRLDARSPIRTRMLDALSLHRKTLAATTRKSSGKASALAKTTQTTKAGKPVVKAAKSAAKPAKASAKTGKAAKVPGKTVKTAKSKAKPTTKTRSSKAPSTKAGKAKNSQKKPAAKKARKG